MSLEDQVFVLSMESFRMGEMVSRCTTVLTGGAVALGGVRLGTNLAASDRDNPQPDREKVPMADSDIVFTPAVELARRLLPKQISAREVLGLPVANGQKTTLSQGMTRLERVG